ncbi:hypothetical protein [Roseibium sp.]|uniref:hypothetical protein n=1 Tax=Roseibium sp. TaxID=1936156 RepID=UPI003BB16DA3
MKDRKPGLGDFGYIIAGRLFASLIAALAVSIAFVLVLAGYYLQAAGGLLSLLILAFAAQQLILTLDPVRPSNLLGMANRSQQPGVFWPLFLLCALTITALVVGIIWYLLVY